MILISIIIILFWCGIFLVGSATAATTQNLHYMHLPPFAFSTIPTKQTQQKQRQQQRPNAFLPSSSLLKPTINKPAMLSKMSYTNDGNNNNDLPTSNTQTEEMIRRLSIRGVSVSPSGFLVLLSTSITSSDNLQQVITIPLRVTNPETMDKDVYAATSAEALTILQLLGNVDMAGTIFPPQILQHIAALHSALKNKDTEENEIIEVEDELGLLSNSDNNDEYYNNVDNVFNQMSAEELMNKFIHQTLPSNVTYDEANVWQRNKVKYPKVSLDEIRVELPMEEESVWKDDVLSSMEYQTAENKEEGAIHPVPLKYILVCTVDETLKLEIPLYSEQVESSFVSRKIQAEIEKSCRIGEKSCYLHDALTSSSFLMTCLALRYKCPVTVSSKVLDSFVSTQDLLDKKMQDFSSSLSSSDEKISDTPKICLVYTQENTNKNENSKIGKAKNSKKHIQRQQKQEEDFISQTLPSWKGANAIRKTSERVDRTVQRGFEENKLRGALRIAMEKGDEGAVKKIRNEIEKLRGLNDDDDDDEEEDDYFDDDDEEEEE